MVIDDADRDEIFRNLGRVIYDACDSRRCDQAYIQAAHWFLGRSELWDAVRLVRGRFPSWRDADGWRPFGYHVGLQVPDGWVLDFGGVDADGDGLPSVERLRRLDEF